MPIIALETLVALQKALPGTVLGPGEARPFLGPELQPVLNLPKVIVPAVGAQAGIAQGSTYFTQFFSITNLAAHQVLMTTLAGGLWRITGNVSSYTSNLVSNDDNERLYIRQETTDSFFMIFPRENGMPSSFDFNLLLRDDGDIGLDVAQTGAVEVLRVYLSMRCEKIL